MGPHRGRARWLQETQMLGAGPARTSALGVALRSLLTASRFSLCASSPSRSIRQGPLSKCPTCHPCSELARDSPASWERPEQGRRFNCSSEDLCEHGQDRTWTVTLAARAARLSHLQNQIYQKAKSSEDRSHKEIWSKGGGGGAASCRELTHTDGFVPFLLGFTGSPCPHPRGRWSSIQHENRELADDRGLLPSGQRSL